MIPLLAIVVMMTSPILDLVVGEEALDQPSGFVVGGLDRARVPATDGIGTLVTTDGAPLFYVTHEVGGEVVLHGLAPEGCRGGPCVVGAPRDLESRSTTLRPLRVSALGDTIEIEGLDRPVVLLPGGLLETAAGLVRIAPAPARAAFRVAHACPLRVEAVLEAELGAGAAPHTAIRIAVAVAPGRAPIDLAVHLEARSRATLGPGLTLEILAPVASIAVDGASPILAGDAPVSLSFGEGAWMREGRIETLGRRRILLGTTPRLGVARPGDLGPGLEHVQLPAGGGGAVVSLLPPGLALSAGEGRIARVRLSFGDAPSTGRLFAIPLAPPPALAPRVEITPGAAAPPSPLSLTTERLVMGFLRLPRHGLVRDGPDAGDWWMDREHVGNLEYDGVLGFLSYAVRRRSPDAFAAAVAFADHSLSVDRDAAGSGLLFQHGRGHRDGTVEAGHHWIAGVLALERLDPDPVRRPLVANLVSSELSALARLDLEKQWPRSLGWGLWALAEAARSGALPKEHRREIRRFRNHLFARRANSGVLLLTKEEGGMAFAESPFVHGGILVPAIAASLEAVPDAEQRGALRSLARAWLRLGVVRDDERFGLSERVSFDRRGNVTGRSGRAEPEFGALFAAGLVAAEPELARDPALQRLVAAVSAAPLDDRRRYLGRNLSVLLRALPWLEREDRREGSWFRR